ncbi:putative F-box protein At1g33020 isoform X2 [Humulus lupulus]|uniref:putative F-box protein At1g33020 isoform X2 n=1 Tax=Humulus lupulus TaxID=3486 RepID=UPI002B406C3C|nr:putative F-box protein At1g33020 isoform X2 [Humulus lupulus]
MANPEKGVLYNNIPCEFLEDILSRLDAKSLKRCECVSKSWLSLLRAPYFTNLHLQRQVPCVVFLQKKDIQTRKTIGKGNTRQGLYTYDMTLQQSTINSVSAEIWHNRLVVLLM